MSVNLPTVSVIIPAKNAAATLPDAISSIKNQTYSRIIEVIVAAADDESSRSAAGAKVIRNDHGSTPIGLNLALREATGDVVVRCDAHAKLPTGYVAMGVEAMRRTNAVNVGGMQVPVGATEWEKAIAAAMSSPFGAGDAKYRIGGDEGPAETVYLGVFDRKALVEIGGFDESFSRTQDYELNHRLLEAGGVVWFNPEMKVEYRPRGSLADLADQYLKYGVAKRAFTRKHPGSLRWRQLAPPALVVGLALSILASIVFPLILLLPAIYVLAVGGASFPSWRKALALMTMHMAWGVGFLIGKAR